MNPKAVFNGKERMSKQPTHNLSACRFRQMANIGGKGLLNGVYVYQTKSKCGGSKLFFFCKNSNVGKLLHLIG